MLVVEYLIFIYDTSRCFATWYFSVRNTFSNCHVALQPGHWNMLSESHTATVVVGFIARTVLMPKLICITQTDQIFRTVWSVRARVKINGKCSFLTFQCLDHNLIGLFVKPAQSQAIHWCTDTVWFDEIVFHLQSLSLTCGVCKDDDRCASVLQCRTILY